VDWHSTGEHERLVILHGSGVANTKARGYAVHEKMWRTFRRRQSTLTNTGTGLLEYVWWWRRLVRNNSAASA